MNISVETPVKCI